jgi:hypothetical protein
VVPMINPAMPITIDAMQRGVGTLLHAAKLLAAFCRE